MEYTISIDNLIITADVHGYTRAYKGADPAYLYNITELEYTIERVLELDEDNIPYVLDSKESDAILCGLENVVKTKLMLEIGRENEE